MFLFISSIFFCAAVINSVIVSTTSTGTKNLKRSFLILLVAMCINPSTAFAIEGNANDTKWQSKQCTELQHTICRASNSIQELKCQTGDERAPSHGNITAI